MVKGEDYALARIPMEERRPMWEVFMIRFGAVVTLSQFMLGAALGYGMTLKDALLATVLGSVLLEIISFLNGVAGAWEGLSTSLLTRWAGFGRLGSSLIGLIVGISCIGWFGIQNTIFAQGLSQAFGGAVSTKIMSVITGVLITLLVVYGYKMLSYTANIAVPGFLVAVGIATYHLLSKYDLNTLLISPPPGPALNFGVAVTMVAGGFMVGAVVTPDLSRYNRNAKDVFWMTLLSIFAGELLITFIAVLMSHAVKSADVITIMLNLGGWISAALVIFSTIKINDLNLYAASLGIANFLDAVFRVKISRAVLTIIIGLLGTLGSVLGILDKFVNFLVILGIAVPPVGGIMVVDYFILKRYRKELEESRVYGRLPKEVEDWNPIAIVSLVLAFLVGYFYKGGLNQALNSLIAGMIFYFVLMKVYMAFSPAKNAKFIKKSEAGEV
ncbi:purine-cytosine permease family protein [Carboxydothermus ferrireducens]|uniref:Cytosine permease n=1 Tax=Carboxydothermus ferrireducens DSM 11255 TaxID=1119529 RepID=A0ABX2RE57_9THEO|nr:cytosine permease [Carboxydothermus ferrireducens]NYE58103.1 cytosine permease [Carboxydothermus ferrireducens DSM 11255]